MKELDIDKFWTYLYNEFKDMAQKELKSELFSCKQIDFSYDPDVFGLGMVVDAEVGACLRGGYASKASVRPGSMEFCVTYSGIGFGSFLDDPPSYTFIVGLDKFILPVVEDLTFWDF